MTRLFLQEEEEERGMEVIKEQLYCIRETIL
jgi:hypothetical protein